MRDAAVISPQPDEERRRAIEAQERQQREKEEEVSPSDDDLSVFLSRFRPFLGQPCEVHLQFFWVKPGLHHGIMLEFFRLLSHAYVCLLVPVFSGAPERKGQELH